VCDTGFTATNAHDLRLWHRLTQSVWLEGFDGLPDLPEGELPVESESAKTFARRFMGYQPAAVDAYVEMLTTKQKLLLDDVESLRTRVAELGDEAGSLRKEVGVLTDNSPAPHAVQQRMAQLLRRTVDEASEMQTEARAEADTLVAAAKAEAEAVAVRQEAMEAEHEKIKEQLETDLDDRRAEAEAAREQLLADVTQEADRRREQAQQAVDAASQQRIGILEQLVGVYRDLETAPAALESAYRELKDPSD
jgi:cell division septum initiation protein DivIVA